MGRYNNRTITMRENDVADALRDAMSEAITKVAESLVENSESPDPTLDDVQEAISSNGWDLDDLGFDVSTILDQVDLTDLVDTAGTESVIAACIDNDGGVESILSAALDGVPVVDYFDTLSKHVTLKQHVEAALASESLAADEKEELAQMLAPASHATSMTAAQAVDAHPLEEMVQALLAAYGPNSVLDAVMEGEAVKAHNIIERINEFAGTPFFNDIVEGLTKQQRLTLRTAIVREVRQKLESMFNRQMTQLLPQEDES